MKNFLFKTDTMKRFSYLLLALCTLVLTGCPGTDPVKYDSMQGLIINEISPAPGIGKPGWIEIYNPSDNLIHLNGLQIFLTSNTVSDELVATLHEGEIAAGSYYIIDTEAAGFTSPLLRATFTEVGIADAEGLSLDSFSLQFDLYGATRLEDGESYARIPDLTGTWTVVNTPTPGEANYKIIPYTLSGLVINEVCPAQGWIEIVNNGKADQHLEYSYIKAADGTLLYTAPAGSVLKGGSRLVVESAEDASKFSSFTYYDNTGKKVVDFTSNGLATPPAGGSWCRLPDITGGFRVTETATKDAENISNTTDLTGLVINEVSLSGWIEICNTTVATIKANSLSIKSGSTTLATKTSLSIPASGKVVFETSVSEDGSFTLCAPDGTVLDSFSKSIVRADSRTATNATSWSRLPDGTGKWYTVLTPSRGEKNYGIEVNNTIGLWVRQSSTNSISVDSLCRLGIGHILLHEYAFKNYGAAKVSSICQQAHERGMKVHIWLQCFWWNDDIKWRSPVIDRVGDTPARYDQDLFNDILNRALGYMDSPIDGIHFDYIRFGGTANKHNFPEDGITGIGAITEFCRQAYTKLKGKNSGIILSAALMGERNAQAYYGQDPQQMTQYIDILMPMAYISSYNYSSSTNVAVANWFADRAGDKQVWHGISTYDSNTHGLSAEEIYRDSYNIKSSRAAGIVLFRDGIGTLPDFNGMFAK